MNVFESGARKVIPAVLIYGRSGDSVLMIHRVSGVEKLARPGDYHAGKWNGLGGKLEADESPLQGARRELREEGSIDLPEGAFRFLGVLQFPNFKAHKGEDWMVFVYDVAFTEAQRQAVPAECPEGQLHWVPIGDLLELNLWPGDRHFIPFIVHGKPFEGTIWYAGPEVIKAEVRPIG